MEPKPARRAKASCYSCRHMIPLTGPKVKKLMKGGTISIPWRALKKAGNQQVDLTKSQVKSLLRALDKQIPAEIKFSKAQIKHHLGMRGQEGAGFFDDLADFGRGFVHGFTKPISMVVDNGLAPLADAIIPGAGAALKPIADVGHKLDVAVNGEANANAGLFGMKKPAKKRATRAPARAPKPYNPNVDPFTKVRSNRLQRGGKVAVGDLVRAFEETHIGQQEGGGPLAPGY